ncbi:MAG: hypothetical protein ACI9R3_002590 [Verrucomicrobiales bacterium]|jgi:hypothetical protein
MTIFQHLLASSCVVVLITTCLSGAEIDFSSCGYDQSETPIPLVSVRAVVTEAGRHDDRPQIQAAIDFVSSLEPDPVGFRGAVLLNGKRFVIRGGLTITTSGVVLRGSAKDKTSVLGYDVSRATMIRLLGRPDIALHVESARRVVDENVPSGAMQLTLDKIIGLELGERVLITRPSTAEWITALGMDREGIAWKPGTRDVRWERRIVGIEGNTIRLDAPITTALEQRFGGGRVETFDWPGRISQVGIENLHLISQPLAESAADCDQPWCGVTAENIENAWVQQVSFSGFPGSAVALWESTKNITVQDCISTEAKSDGGYRRHTFFTMGQQTLFLRCWSDNGRHDFSAGHCAPGPNAFVQCHARTTGFSGPIESWVSGLLYDNVTIDGAGLHFENRWRSDGGTGWCAANCTIWQSDAAEFRCFNPPGAVNRAVGIWGTPSGDGSFEHLDEFANPRSLFKAQLAKRLGGEAKVAHLGPIGRDYVSSTNPTPTEAAAFAKESSEPARSLRDLIVAAPERNKLWADEVPGGAKMNPEPEKASPPPARRPLSIKGGELMVGGEPLTGKRFTPIWWRGNIRPGEAPAFGPAITRFVPGRIGKGFTDDLEAVAREMVQSGFGVVEHHHGLWYDRRRDDHTHVRRADGNVAPPFYEQPFARSGIGSAWDGLSQYDLSKFNGWYWHRLTEFARLSEQKDLALFNQHYFQHNLLEAGAHWTDFPWREANNINITAFPEPPPYIGDKRIFQAHLFYDATNQFRRPLHRNYIRQHLDAFAGNPNVIHSIGAEFTGPLEFVEFWIDTIVEWESETGKDAIVCLSCTKDVQDAILADPTRGKAISIIDIRYWWYTSDGELYAPEGGKHLSPRQHARQLKPKKASQESTARAVREYRVRYPDKVIFINGEPRGTG